MADDLRNKQPVTVGELTEREQQLIDKRRETSRLNAEKARQRRLENKQKLKELQELEYQTKREDFDKKMASVIRPKASVKPQVQPIEEESESEDEEEYIIKFNSAKKKKQDESEQLKKELELMRKEMEEMKKKKEEPAPTPAPPQIQKQIIVVKPPNSDMTNNIRREILKF